MIHDGVSDRVRGPLWMKLLEIEKAMAVHSDNLYQKLLEFHNEEAER